MKLAPTCDLDTISGGECGMEKCGRTVCEYALPATAGKGRRKIGFVRGLVVAEADLVSEECDQRSMFNL